jgi:hypothetical protein
MSTVFNGEHDVLVGHAMRLLDALDGLSGRLAPRRVDRVQHREFADRAALLGDHLRGALQLALDHRYASAFVVVRTSLEHHLLDRLVFLATRFTNSYVVPLDKVDEEERRLAKVKATRPDLRRVDITRHKSDAEVVLTFSGYHAEGRRGRPPTISRWFFLLDEYDPFAGTPSRVTKLAAPFRDLEGMRRWAKESQALWERYLKTRRLLADLRLNRLLTAPQTLQVEVHYSFLSTFVHATQAAYGLVYGRNRPSRLGRFDHYASELVLLYVIALASEELGFFARACRRAPAVPLRNWGEVETATRSARTASDYFWFLHGHPTALDRIGEVHTRVDPKQIARGKGAVHDPARVARVRYYGNPLRRLVELHGSFVEGTTGLGYQSPWPRADARLR